MKKNKIVLQTPKVLIADDDKELISCLEQALETEPFFCFFVNSTEDEVREARTGNYDFILTDLQMPYDEEGIDAIKEIRKFDKRVPIVMHTSYENPEVWQRARDAGANEVISKNATPLFEYGNIIRRYL
jgi:CheY-like chemotaxis protein